MRDEHDFCGHPDRDFTPCRFSSFTPTQLVSHKRLSATLACACALLLTVPGTGSAQDHDYVLEARGELLYQHYDYRDGSSGSTPASRATMDVRRLVLENLFYIQPSLCVEAEIEFEHGGTGSHLELADGSLAEAESEKGGEVLLETLHLTKSFSDAVQLRVGHFELPVGLLNRYHEPDDYFTTIRPESESSLLPSTWSETGLMGLGHSAGFDYRLAVVNGLDATGFSSEHWIVGGNQKKFEMVQATALAGVARLDFSGLSGFTVGGSAYYGNSTPNRPTEDMKGTDGYVTILDAHSALELGGLVARGLFLYGHLQNAGAISAKNSGLSASLQVPGTPVATEALAYYAEVGFDLLSLFRSGAEPRLYPFVRYDYYNSMHAVEQGITADPLLDRKLYTAGLNFFVSPDVVIKADYSHRVLGGGQFNSENTIGVAVGFMGTFLDTRKS